MRIPQRLGRLADRIHPLLPERMEPIVRTATSIVKGGPLVGLPALRRVLVLAPHPDDETIGPGGTLALLAAAGTAVTVVIVTSGEATPGTGLRPDEIAVRRKAEAVEACRRLGLDQPRFLGHVDGTLPERVQAVSDDLAGLLAEHGPDAIFLPWFGDGHPDHRALTAALSLAVTQPVTQSGAHPASASGGRTDCEVWGYETWAPLPANRLVDITTAMPKKQAALDAHTTAHAAFDLDAMTGLNRYRSLHGLAGRGWAEAFLAMPLGRYLDVAAGRPPVP